MDFTIRTAHPEELDAVGALTGRVYLAGGLLKDGEQDFYLGHLRDARTRARHARILVAVEQATESLLGAVAYVGDGGEYADIAGPGEAEFRMLVVAPDARGRGVGEALVRVCMKLAEEEGRHRLVLSTQPVMHAAHRLYERLGFVRTPERDWEPVPGVPLKVFVLEI